MPAITECAALAADILTRSLLRTGPKLATWQSAVVAAGRWAAAEILTEFSSPEGRAREDAAVREALWFWEAPAPDHLKSLTVAVLTNAGLIPALSCLADALSRGDTDADVSRYVSVAIREDFADRAFAIFQHAVKKGADRVQV